MFSIFRAHLHRHCIDNGRVGCPIRSADVEVDDCARCRRLVDIDATGNAPYVYCDARPFAELWSAAPGRARPSF